MLCDPVGVLGHSLVLTWCSSNVKLGLFSIVSLCSRREVR